jgi:putative ABC transport system substrate-binding protein
VPRVGYVHPGWSVPDEPSPLLEAFRQGLRDHGYVEGVNVVLEERASERQPDRYPQIVAELVSLPVDVLLIQDSTAIPIALQATRTIPIVFALAADPVSSGYVQSLARPGGNATGVTLLQDFLNAKRLEMLTRLAPSVKRVGVLRNAAYPEATREWERLQPAAQTLGLELLSSELTSPADLPPALQRVVERPVHALFVIADSVVSNSRFAIAQFAQAHRLPGMYPNRDFVTAGGLISYAPDRRQNLYRAAYFVDKIIRGTPPTELPVERPARFELVLNLKAAREIGITVPAEMRSEATEVITD